MATNADKARKEAKRAAVVERINLAHHSLDVLSGMWDEHILDTLILAFGIGHVELDE
jgi:hypothetical protein